jgi:hypothetical protein
MRRRQRGREFQVTTLQIHGLMANSQTPRFSGRLASAASVAELESFPTGEPAASSDALERALESETGRRDCVSIVIPELRSSARSKQTTLTGSRKISSDSDLLTASELSSTEAGAIATVKKNEATTRSKGSGSQFASHEKEG